MFTGWELSHTLARGDNSQSGRSALRFSPPGVGGTVERRRQATPGAPETARTEQPSMRYENQGSTVTPDGAPTDDREVLDAVLNVRLRRSEKAALGREARLAGLSVSALARRRCLGRKVAVGEVNLEAIHALRLLDDALGELDRSIAPLDSERPDAHRHHRHRAAREGTAACRRRLAALIEWLSQ